jgi:putative aldouronate transport system permease protein
MERATRGYRVFSFFNGMIMLMVIFATAYPMYYVLIASFSDPAALSRATGALWLPMRPFTLGAYRLVFGNPMIGRGFLNTAFVLAAGVAVNIALTAMGAYFLSLKGPMLKTAITLMIVFTMYFSGGLIPSYLNLRDLKLLDSLWALILPSAVNTTNLIIMKTAFQSIPDSLVQSARLDGASHLRILASITLPLSMATVAVIILYYGVAHWNAWFGASIYLRNRDLFPLQLVMRNILSSLSLNEMMGGASMDEMARIAELIKYALIVVATGPILLLYPFLQKYFVKGVMVGAIKG